MRLTPADSVVEDSKLYKNLRLSEAAAGELSTANYWIVGAVGAMDEALQRADENYPGQNSGQNFLPLKDVGNKPDKLRELAGALKKTLTTLTMLPDHGQGV